MALFIIISFTVFVLFCFLLFLWWYRSDCDLTLSYYALKGKNLHLLRGKVIWITGASSGIGETLAYTLARCGAKLILSARREEELARVRAKCRDVSPEDNRDSHMVLVMDLLKYDSHEKLVEQVILEYGKIDYLVNNAGVSQRAADEDTKFEVIEMLLKTNTLGPISLTKAVLPCMIKQRNGCFVFMSSAAGKMASPGSAGYGASKHALQGYLEALRLEITNKGIDVISICPGPVHSNFLREVLGTEIKKGSGSTAAVDHASVGDRISVDRCAYLVAISMVNKLDEVWISQQPILMFMYVFQYAPVFARRLGKKIGIRRVEAIKSGKKDIDKHLLF